LAGGASHLYGQPRGKLRPERGAADPAGLPVGPDGVGRYFGSAQIHQNGASEGGHHGNVVAVPPRHGWLASAGGSGCRRGGYDLASAEKPAATRMTTPLSQDTRYRVEGFGKQCGFGRVGKRISPPVGFGRPRRGIGGPGLLEALRRGRMSGGRRSKCMDDAVIESRSVLRYRARCEGGGRLVGAYRQSLEYFGARADGVRTERQGGNGCGDAVRLPARGILRRV
jgi:hypothetical protein